MTARSRPMTPLAWAIALALVWLLASALACAPQVALVAGARLACQTDGDCPRAMLCIEGERGGGLCADAASPCLTAGGVPVADGTSCANGVCAGGICRVPGCGDGIVDVGAGEECDVADDRLCRADCTVPFCGDGIVDVNESCDQVDPACQECVFTCAVIDPSNPEGTARRSNCNLDVSDGCECDLEYVVGEGGDQYAWQSAASGDDVYFTHYSSAPTLYRYRADADPPLRSLAASDGVSLAATDDGVYALVYEPADDDIALVRVEGDTLSELRRGFFYDLGSDFAIHEGVIYVVTSAGVRASSTTGTDEPILFTDACAGFTDITACAGLLYCSSPSRGDLVAITPAVLDGGEVVGGGEVRVVGSFDVDNDAPVLTCADETVFVQDLGRLGVVVRGGALVELERFPAAGSNFGGNLTFDRSDPGHLFLTLGIGAAGPYAYRYELATGRLAPVARGHALAIDGEVALTDDFNFTGGIARVQLEQP